MVCFKRLSITNNYYKYEILNKLQTVKFISSYIILKTLILTFFYSRNLNSTCRNKGEKIFYYTSTIFLKYRISD